MFYICLSSLHLGEQFMSINYLSIFSNSPLNSSILFYRVTYFYIKCALMEFDGVHLDYSAHQEAFIPGTFISWVWNVISLSGIY